MPSEGLLVAPLMDRCGIGVSIPRARTGRESTASRRPIMPRRAGLGCLMFSTQAVNCGSLPPLSLQQAVV